MTFAVNTSVHISATDRMSSSVIGPCAVVLVGPPNESHLQILTHDEFALEALANVLLRTAKQMRENDAKRAGLVVGLRLRPDAAERLEALRVELGKPTDAELRRKATEDAGLAGLAADMYGGADD
jgi:hypothetical protein